MVDSRSFSRIEKIEKQIFKMCMPQTAVDWLIWAYLKFISRVSTLFSRDLLILGSVRQRCKNWWNRGTRFPERKSACRKFFGLRKIIKNITFDMSADKYLSADIVINVSADNDFNTN